MLYVDGHSGVANPCKLLRLEEIRLSNEGTLTDKADLSKFYSFVVCMNVPTDLSGGLPSWFPGGPQGVLCDNESMMPYLLGQEMGHGYGLGHSRADGSEADYEDPWDVMSTGGKSFQHIYSF